MFCRFFILRPVLSIVISIIIVLAGTVAIAVSPISQYPDITPPSIKITATFPGANSETIANTVAAPLEDQLSGVSNMIYMQSSSSNSSNNVVITIYFDIGTDLNSMLSDVLNRINTAMPLLPLSVTQQGIVVRKSSPDLFLIIDMFSNGQTDLLYLSNYVYRYVYPVLSQVNGVGSVSVIGTRIFAMRVLLDPRKLAYYHVGVPEVIRAIKEQNKPFTIGLMGMAPTNGNSQFQFMINADSYFTGVKQFENVIIRAQQNNHQNQIIHLKDIGRVTLAGNQYNTNIIKVEKDAKGHFTNHKEVALLVYLTPGVNELLTKTKVSNAMNLVGKHLPAGINYEYHYDSTNFVKASIRKVIDTFRDAFILVFLVIFLFMQNLRGTIIPIIAIPVSIIGTFAGTYALGFSINTLTLFGVVLAIGIVVDDAIVVLENVERIMEEKHMTSVDAAILAMKEVAAPIIAIVFALNAVFLPIAFLGGFAGMLFKQFAVTISISVFISGIVALTLTPTLCALFLKDGSNKTQFMKGFFTLFNQYFNKFRDYYVYLVKFFLNHVKLSYLVFILLSIVTGYLYKIVPESLMPIEDMAYFYTGVNLPSASSLDRSTNSAIKLCKYLSSLNSVVSTLAIGGIDLLDNVTNKTNAALVVTVLKPWKERSKVNSQQNIVNQVNLLGLKEKDARYTSFNSPSIRGLSQSGGVTFYLQATSSVSIKEIYDDTIKLEKELYKNNIINRVIQFYEVKVPQLYIKVDREKAKLYGVNIDDIFDTLHAIFGNYYVNYFEKWNDLWWVILQSQYSFRDTPELLNTVYVKNNIGQMIPVGSLATVSFVNGPEVVTRFNDYLASQLVVDPKPGYTSGDVMKVVTDTADRVLHGKYLVQWFGPAYEQAHAGSSSRIAIILGIAMVYLILAALYELWSVPLSVIMAIPFSIFGAILMLLITNRPNDIFFQVSLITLVGLSAKNAILIVEFALDAIKKGKSVVDAAVEGAYLRFRPIIMTSMAFILGTLPLALASGAGANSQHSVGTGIIGGMIGSTFLATLFVPLFFVTVMKLKRK